MDDSVEDWVGLRAAAMTAGPADPPLLLDVGCRFRHRLESPVAVVLQVEPRPDGPHTVVEESWDTSGAPTRTYRDLYGNLCRRMVIPAGESTIDYHATVEASGGIDPADVGARQLGVDELPAEALVHTLPSRLCPSDELATTAWRTFGDLDGGWERVQTICDWVHDSVVFETGCSTPQTTATMVLLQRRGVCRDFAHLAVSLCRALNIPARYVVGYLPDIDVVPLDAPMDFCAWFEAYLGDRWWTFDPRNNQRRRGRVVIGRGRDAVDVAMITSYGAAPLLEMTVWADRAAARTAAP